MALIKRPTLYKMVDILYDYHFDKASNLYPKGTSLMIEGTIKKIACLASIEHCDKQITLIKPNTKKTIYTGERYSDELVYWITIKEMIKAKQII
jgi:hypothetical protein